MPDPIPSPEPLAEHRTTAIFAKCPRPGQVKTRLCPPLDSEAAAELAAAMLADVGARMAACPWFRTQLWFTPAAEEGWFASALPRIRERRVQRGADLGERLASFFRDELDSGRSRSAVAIGSDAPLLDPAILRGAHERLEAGADLVLGPDAGGGYYLVGLRRPCDELFTEVEMSTGDMYAKTRELAERLGLAVETTEPSYDVDVEADLARLRRDLSALEPSDRRYPSRTAALLATMAGGFA